MTESATMTLIAIGLGIGVFCFFLHRMIQTVSDERFKNLTDYLLVFKRGIEILNDKRWLVFVPLGIALFGWALQFASNARIFVHLDGLDYRTPFSSYFFSGGLISAHYALSSTIGALPYIAPNAFVTVGIYNVVAPGLIYFPVCYALMFLLGFNKIREILRQAGDASPRFLRRLLYPSLACSLVVLFLYGSLLGTYEADETLTGQWIVRLAQWFGHLGLGGLFFAFFMGLFTYIVYEGYSTKATREPIDLEHVLANAEPLLLFWVLLFLMRGPAGYMLNPPPVGPALFPGLVFFVLLLLFSLLLLFVPMTIVARRQSLVNGLKSSLRIWRTEYPRILVFLVIAGMLSLAVRLLGAVLNNLPELSFSLLDFLFSTVALCVQLFVHLWIMASWVGLFHRLSPAEVGTLGDNGNGSPTAELVP